MDASLRIFNFGWLLCFLLFVIVIWEVLSAKIFFVIIALYKICGVFSFHFEMSSFPDLTITVAMRGF